MVAVFNMRSKEVPIQVKGPSLGFKKQTELSERQQKHPEWSNQQFCTFLKEGIHWQTQLHQKTWKKKRQQLKWMIQIISVVK